MYAGCRCTTVRTERRDSWRGSDTTQEIEFNKININCRVHGESEERSFNAVPTALVRAVRAR